nr:hypothetical protein [Tanacetum cinerariifolium]
MVLNNKGKITGPKENRPVWDNTARVKHQNKLTHPHPKRNYVPIAVLTKSRQVPVHAAKQSSHRAAESVSNVRRVNTATSEPNVNNALPTTYSYLKAHLPVRKPFNPKSVAKTNKFNEKVNTAKHKWSLDLLSTKKEKLITVKKSELLNFTMSLIMSVLKSLKKLKTLMQEKEGVDGKLAGLLTASKDLNNLIESQRADKNKEGLGYSVVPPPPAQLYSSPKKDLS